MKTFLRLFYNLLLYKRFLQLVFNRISSVAFTRLYFGLPGSPKCTFIRLIKLIIRFKARANRRVYNVHFNVFTFWLLLFLIVSTPLFILEIPLKAGFQFICTSNPKSKLQLQTNVQLGQDRTSIQQNGHLVFSISSTPTSTSRLEFKFFYE